MTEAVGHYEQALRLKPDYIEAHNNLGNALLDSGKVPEAIGQFEQALRLKPDYIEAYNNRGNSYLNQGNTQLGCSDAQKVCAWGDCRLLEIARSRRDCR